METFQHELPPNPHESANYFSILFFTWTIPLFRRGFVNILKLEDLFQPPASDTSGTLGDRLQINWIKRTPTSVSCSLLTVIIATFWKDYTLLAIFHFFNDIVLLLGQRLLLANFLLYFRKNSDVTYQEAFTYAIGVVLLTALSTLFSNHITFLSSHYGMKIRVAVCSLIYRKALRLSHAAPGKVANLLSNDVHRFDQVSSVINFLWISPLLTFIVGCLLWNEIGVAGIVGIAIVLTIVPILSYAAKLTSKFRLKTALKTDERMRFMDEIISGMQIIKMYALEMVFAKQITNVRKLELTALRKINYIRAFHSTAILFITRMAVFCTMLSIVLLHGSDHITGARIFIISSYFSITSHVMSQQFLRGISETAEVLVAIKRLEKFLNLAEKTFDTSQKVTKAPECSPNLLDAQDRCSKISISMRNVRARHVVPNNDILDDSSMKKPPRNKKWKTKKKSDTMSSDDSERHSDMIQNAQTVVLDCLNVEFPKGKLIGVVGPVGAGKSSFLQLLLRELPLESGSLDINGSISYASQEPWMFAATIRKNITFGEKYDQDRYNAVIHTCGLAKDLEQLDNGDQTIVGYPGVNLSSGQKARINLARACYRNADIYLLDDPLSVVDAHVGTHIFKRCIGPKSRLEQLNATRILVTHQVHFLKEADWLVVLKDGKIEVQGTPADLASKGVNYVQLDTVDVEENFEIFYRQAPRMSSPKSTNDTMCNFVDQPQKDDEKGKESIINQKDVGVPMEDSSKGKIKGSLSIKYFKAGTHWCVLLILFISFVFVEFLATAADHFVLLWTKQEESRTFQKHHNFTISPISTESHVVSRSATNATERQPTQYERHSYTLSTQFCVIVQVTLVAALFIFGIARSVGFYAVCLKNSQNLHNSMFSGIISTSMRFFVANPSGRILNRLAKDIGAVDEVLPKSILDAAESVLNLFGVIVVTAFINPYFLLPTLFLSCLFILIKNIYLKTSKNVKRLEGIAKSPVFTHLAATLTGLPTVRAHGAEQILRSEFDHHQDTHSACWYMIISTRSMFALSLDIITFIFICCLIFYCMLLEARLSVEKISFAISLTGLLRWAVHQCAEVSNQMMAVERVLEYKELEGEKQPKKLLAVANDWPSKGCIEFRNVFYRYSIEAEPMLRNLSFVIKPMEKIGIVGRIGAGKSSLIGSLFRLACVDGEILIDGVDTAEIQLSELRKNIAIIPQDPVLFSGTLRRNLDPFEEYSDADIWNALENVEMKGAISDSLGLQSRVFPHGANFSVGQRQLLCLARAILRKNRILVMDESTANVDPQTDLLIQQTIREKFTECTVLTIAHRLHRIIDCDRVIIMDSGRVVEFDVPYNLLQNKNSFFYDMVKALGKKEFHRLCQIAMGKLESSNDDQLKSS